MIFSAAWRDGFFGRFLSALEPKKVVQNGVPKKKNLNDFLFFFSFRFFHSFHFVHVFRRGTWHRGRGTVTPTHTLPAGRSPSFRRLLKNATSRQASSVFGDLVPREGHRGPPPIDPPSPKTFRKGHFP